MVVGGGCGRKSVLGEFASAFSSAVVVLGGGFWVKGVEKYVFVLSVYNLDIRIVCIVMSGFLDGEFF